MEDGKHVSYPKEGNINDIHGCDVILTVQFLKSNFMKYIMEPNITSKPEERLSSEGDRL
jgi:hypothetical protein